MIQTPFYICEGKRCAQTSLKSILEYKGISKSIKALDKLVGADNENPVPILSIANALISLNQDFIYPVRSCFEECSLNSLEKLVKDSYPRSIYSKFNMCKIKDSFNNIKTKRKYITLEDRPSLKMLKNFIDGDNILLCLINADKYLNRNDRKRGHYLIINDIGKRFVYVNDSGPKTASKNRRILREDFQKCWDLGIIDWDLLIVK